MRYKPGYRTSEFWFTMVSFIFSGLYLLGIINDNSQKEELINNISHGVESCILIGGQLAILWKYINSRKEVKKSWWLTQIPETPTIVEVPQTPEVIENERKSTTDTKHRTSKTRTRKNNRKNKRKPQSGKNSSDK